MSINQLYQRTIKRHSLTPYGQGACFEATHRAEGLNPSCGDELNIWLKIKTTEVQATISQIGFDIDACAICTAATSLLSQYCEGKTLEKIVTDAHQFEHDLRNTHSVQIESLQCLSAVSAHPSRINCALLPWNTLLKACQSPLADTAISDA